MSEENKNEFDFEEFSKSIHETVSKTVDGVNSRLDDQDKRFNQINEGLKDLKSKNIDDDDELDLDDDLPASKKDLEKLWAEREEKLTKKILGNVNETLNETEKQKKLDAQAFTEFPFLNQNAKNYSKDFASDVQKEIAARTKDGVSKNDPRLLLDAARAVALSNPQYIKLKTNVVEEVINEQNKRDSHFSIKNSTNKKGGSTLNENQKRLALRLGLKPEDAEKTLKKMGY